MFIFLCSCVITNEKYCFFYLVLGPINAKAKMKMNPKPELDGSDYTIPKYSIYIDMESLNISKYNIFRSTRFLC